MPTQTDFCFIVIIISNCVRIVRLCVIEMKGCFEIPTPLSWKCLHTDKPFDIWLYKAVKVMRLGQWSEMFFCCWSEGVSRRGGGGDLHKKCVGMFVVSQRGCNSRILVSLRPSYVAYMQSCRSWLGFHAKRRIVLWSKPVKASIMLSREPVEIFQVTDCLG